MSTFPLPPVPNFRVQSGEPGLVRLQWADYPSVVKAGHKLLGFRVYRSANKNELGKRIADESVLGPGAVQFDDTDPQAGPDRHYVCVAVEDSGFGKSPFGRPPFGEKNTNGFSLFPYGFRPRGSPLRGFGEAPYGAHGYGS